MAEFVSSARWLTRIIGLPKLPIIQIKHWILPATLALGVVHGSIYLFLMPPWQHYDEPTQFEYAWLIANRSGFPKPGDFDPEMRRQVGASMLEQGFFRDIGSPPDYLSQIPVPIGFSQLFHPPFYYALVSLPLRLMGNDDVTKQLYTGRLISFMLYLLTIGIAYGLTADITSAQSHLRFVVPATLALLPGFTDLMTALNSDVGATAIFSLFLWGSVRIIQRGFSFLRLFWIVGAALLCLWTKDTVMVAVPLLILPLLFSILNGSRRWLAWLLLAIGCAAGILLMFSWGDAALWYRQSRQPSATRISTSQAPVGKNALMLEMLPQSAPLSQVYQPLPIEQVTSLRGKTVTLGAWIWASEPTQGRTPILIDGPLFKNETRFLAREIALTQVPTFYAMTNTVSASSTVIQIALQAAGKENAKVFYNGIVLVEGELPITDPPRFLDNGATRGVWSGRPFVNLARNPSAEQTWLYVNPRVETFVEDAVGKNFYFITRASLILDSLFDWDASGWYYFEAAKQLHRTFWAKLGWGHISFPGSFYWALAFVSLGGLLAATIVVLQNWRTLPWAIILFLGTAFVLIWGQAMVRGVQSIIFDVFIPSARYAFPAIIPTLLLLNSGWGKLLERFGAMPRTVVQFVLFLVLDAVTIINVIQFYFGR